MTLHPTEPMMGTSAAFMELGEWFLNHPLRKKRAVECYEAAAYVAETDIQRAQAFQMLGITWRILRNLSAAVARFDDALNLVQDDPIWEATILRDKAMAYLSTPRGGFIDEDERIEHQLEAAGLLAKSLQLTTKVETRKSQLEWAITQGFRARLLRAEGNFSEARRVYQNNYGIIKRSGNDNYHLNYLMTWLLVAHPDDRGWMNRRIRDLIRATGQTRRYLQLPFANAANIWLGITKK